MNSKLHLIGWPTQNLPQKSQPTFNHSQPWEVYLFPPKKWPFPESIRLGYPKSTDFGAAVNGTLLRRRLRLVNVNRCRGCHWSKWSESFCVYRKRILNCRLVVERFSLKLAAMSVPIFVLEPIKVHGKGYDFDDVCDWRMLIVIDVSIGPNAASLCVEKGSEF